MIYSLPPIEEVDALKRILRHHGVTLNRALITDVSALLSWVHHQEKAKCTMGPNRNFPPPMLSFLGSLGIYGAEAINTTTESENTNEQPG